MRIPVFQQIDELHHATETLQQTVWNDFHIYRNEDANETCVNTMEPHRCNFFQLSIDLRSDYSLWHNAQQLHTNIYNSNAKYKIVAYHDYFNPEKFKMVAEAIA